MTPETTLILKLLAQVIGKLGSGTRSNTTKNNLPPELQRKVNAYSSFANVWSYADQDLLALLAVSELTWEKSIAPVMRKDENQLQIDFGVNVFSKHATDTALTRMQQARTDLEMLRTQSEALSSLAGVLANRGLLGGPFNASQIIFDKMGRDKVVEQSARNIKALDDILKKLKAITRVTEQTARAHVARR